VFRYDRSCASRSVYPALSRFIGFVHKHVIAPDLNAFHAHEGAFEERTREQNSVLVPEALGDKKAVSRTAAVEKVETIGYTRAQ
jgi:hypothetical protein